MSRLADVTQLYDLLGHVEHCVGGKRLLADCDGRREWPDRGVYFVFERGEQRTGSGTGLGVVRVGTHALTAQSRTSLWNRLSQHRGTSTTGGGNHRGSVFRQVVGAAIKKRDSRFEPASGGRASDPAKAAREIGISPKELLTSEKPLEIDVSSYIRQMPFLWMAINDAPGDRSHRGIIERGCIALLSNFNKPPIDPPSAAWLGSHSDRERIWRSGLWNSNHVDEDYDPAFLQVFERHVQALHAG